MPLIKSDLFLMRAYSLIGVPYIYGGQRLMGPNPVIDCSGLVIEIGDEMGRFSDDFDTTAQGLYELLVYGNSNFSPSIKSYVPMNYNQAFNHLLKLKPGSLIFWGKDTKSIKHVSIFCGYGIMIDAAGGGSSTTTVEIANKQGAQVKQRLVSDKKDMAIVAMVEDWI